MSTEGTTLNSANLSIKFLLRRRFDDVLRMLPVRIDRRRLDDESRRRGAQHGASQWSLLIDTVFLNKECISRCMHGRRARLRFSLWLKKHWLVECAPEVGSEVRDSMSTTKCASAASAGWRNPA